MFYFKKIPAFISNLFPGVIWRLPRAQPTVYLTFDDGPSSCTSALLDLLKEYDVSATFFCLGKSVEKYPDALPQIIRAGHTIGHHGYDHLDGWRANTKSYVHNLGKSEALFESNLFRPPYGRISPKQYQRIIQEKQIILWDIMPGDFNSENNPATIKNRITQNIQNGSIIVLHDTPEAWKKNKVFLPELLEGLLAQKYSIEGIKKEEVSL